MYPMIITCQAHAILTFWHFDGYEAEDYLQPITAKVLAELTKGKTAVQEVGVEEVMGRYESGRYIEEDLETDEVTADRPPDYVPADAELVHAHEADNGNCAFIWVWPGHLGIASWWADDDPIQPMYYSQFSLREKVCTQTA